MIHHFEKLVWLHALLNSRPPSISESASNLPLFLRLQSLEEMAMEVQVQAALRHLQPDQASANCTSGFIRCHGFVLRHWLLVRSAALVAVRGNHKSFSWLQNPRVPRPVLR